MKLTPRLLKAELIIVGGIATAACLSRLTNGRFDIWTARAVGNAAIALAWLFLGVRLRTILATAPGVVIQLFHATLVWLVVQVLVEIALGSGVFALPAAAYALLAWYFSEQFRKLAHDPINSVQPVGHVRRSA